MAMITLRIERQLALDVESERLFGPAFACGGWEFVEEFSVPSEELGDAIPVLYLINSLHRPLGQWERVRVV